MKLISMDTLITLGTSSPSNQKLFVCFGKEKLNYANYVYGPRFINSVEDLSFVTLIFSQKNCQIHLKKSHLSTDQNCNGGVTGKQISAFA
jgi:hypothetical protein